MSYRLRRRQIVGGTLDEVFRASFDYRELR
jgi:hypothetical protein